MVERLVRALEHLEGDVVRPAEREAVRRRIEEDGVVRRLMLAESQRRAHLSSKLDLHRLPEGDGEAKVLALHRRAALRLRLLPLMSALPPSRELLVARGSAVASSARFELAIKSTVELTHLLKTRLQRAHVASGNLLRRRGRSMAEGIVDTELGVVGRLRRHLVGVGGRVHSRGNNAMGLFSA